MPKSKHRRKPGGKVVAHPGRGKLGKPLRIDWPDEDRLQAEVQQDVSDLPLWRAADAAKLPEGARAEETERHSCPDQGGWS